jgi:hypothetical protein
MAKTLELLKAEAIEQIATDLAALTAADRTATEQDVELTGLDRAATGSDVVLSNAAATEAENARDEAEQSAGIVSQATSVAGLTDPTTLIDGDGGLVLGSGDDAIDGYYEVEANSPNEWVRKRATGLAGKLDKIEVTGRPTPSKVVKSIPTGYINSTWLAPQNSLPDDAQTLISPQATIPEGWRDTGATVGTRKIISRDLWSEVKHRMAVSRVDIVGVGDSNQLLGNHGHDSAWQKELVDAGIPMWATGLVSQNENNGSGSGQGYLYSRFGSLIGSQSGAPSELDAFLNKGAGSLYPAHYTYVANGSSVGSHTACGLTLEPDCPIDNGAALTFDIHYGTFNSESGTFKPFVRIEESPWTGLKYFPPVSTNTGSFGMARISGTIDADVTRSSKPVGGKPVHVAGEGITGPYFNTYYRFRNTGRTTGFSYGTLEYKGGQSLRTMAVDLQEASDEALTHYFGILREDQDQDQNTIVMNISSGLNDKNETLTSVGPNPNADANSPEAFVDNFRAIYNRIVEIWALNNWPMNELFFFFFVSHPISDPDDTELISYRAAIAEYVAQEIPRGEVVDLSTLTNETEILGRGGYQNGGADRNHLEEEEYEFQAALMLDAGRFV